MVAFRNELLLEVMTDDPNFGTETFMYSTVKQINDMSMNELGQPLIRSQLLDADADGKLDRLDLHLELRSISGPNRLPIAQSVRQVRVIGTVDYSLQQTV